jgi:hypothetical protein
MAKISEIYTGQFLNASELPNHRGVAVIVAAEAETVGQGDQAAKKIVLELRAPDGRPWPKRVILNKGNALVLAAAFSDDSALWHNRSIQVWKEKVMYQGKLVDGIRMAPAPANGAGAGVPIVTPPSPSTAELLDDDIPF